MVTTSPARRASPLKMVSEATREREMYRHWPAFQTGQGVLDFQRATPDTTRLSSVDVILTALAQLGIYHVGAERAYISLFDSEYQYFIAEATASTYLRPSAPNHKHNQPLELCGTATRRINDVCSYTLLNQPCKDSAVNGLANGLVNGDERSDARKHHVDDCQLPVTVVSDSIQDARFRSWSASDSRHAPFHAAVPIRTKRGINIGVYSVTNSSCTGQWTDTDADRMRDIASAISVHLEAESMKAANRRNTRMTRGLGSFLEGSSTISGTRLESNQTAFADAAGPAEGNLNLKQQSLQRDNDEMAYLNGYQAPFGRDGSPVQDGHVRLEDPIARVKHVKETISENQTLENVFSRAANIIRESVEVEGCFFLDATMAGYRATGAQRAGDLGSGMQSSSTSSDENTSRSDGIQHTAVCEIKGFSTSASSSIDRGKHIQDSISLSQKFVRKMLQRYPHGKIFNFSGSGELQTSDSSSSEQLPSPRRKQGATSPTGSNTSSHRWSKATEVRLLSRQREGKVLSAAFPGARSVAFFPVRDPSSEHWRAGGFVYTNSPPRSFTLEGELSYLRAFGIVAAAEILRLEISQADKAKSDALGALSHELRSPLHGVLLSTELMADTNLDVFQSNIAHTIETCSRTLLDTIDHLLDYSRVNSFTGSNKPTPGNALKRQPTSPHAGFAKKSLVSDYPLDALVEEVVESVFAGFNFQHKSIRQLVAHKQQRGRDPSHADSFANSTSDYREAMDQLSPGAEISRPDLGLGNVSVILSLDTDCDWLFRFHVGAVRRIVMNIVGNSLKYTRQGTITVFLSQEVASIRRRRPEKVIRLKVQDTGIGIGEEYLRSGIFKPFTQEDDLRPGTGLGLSLVDKIVSQLKGQIQIDSQVNLGTTVNILLPLTRPAPFGADLQISDAQSRFNNQVRDLKGLRIRLVSAPVDHSTPVLDLRNALEHTCREWFKIEVLADDDFSKQPDLVLWTQDSLPVGETNIESIAYTPNIVVCSDALAAHERTRLAEAANWRGVFEFISQPVGPQKLAKALSLAYSRWTDHEGPQATPSPRPSTISRPPAPERNTSISLSQQDGYKGVQRVAMDAKLRSSQHSSTRAELTHGSEQLPKDLPPSKKQKMPETQGVLKKFLLVDDNHINLKILSSFMKKLQVPYDTATNGKEAVDQYTQAPESYACILLDISMPVMNGFEAARHIRSFEDRRGVSVSIPIFALSGLASEDAQREAYGSGFNLFLLKPVRLQVLGEILREKGILDDQYT